MLVQAAFHSLRSYRREKILESIKLFFTKRTTVIAMIATIVSGLAVHFYKFTNDLPTWDSMYLIDAPIKGTSNFGRWFSGISANLLSSEYSVPWVIGLVSLILLALTVALLTDLFEIHQTFYILLTAVLLVTFPSVTATFAYMEWADAYFLSFFFSILAVYLCIKRKRTYLLPALLISLSMGIYQVYFSTAIICFLLYLFKRHILDNERLMKQKWIVLSFSINLLLGVVLYFVINKLNLAYWGIDLSEYQGVDSVGLLSLDGYMQAFVKTIDSFGSFFMGKSELTLYLVLNAAFLLLFAILLLLVFVIAGVRKFASLLVFFVASLVVSHVYYFASSGVLYHTVMIVNIYFVFFLAILILMNVKMSKFLIHTNVIVLMLLAFYHFVNANVAYTQMQMSYEKSYFTATEIMTKADSINDGSIRDIVVAGGVKSPKDSIEALPKITGASSDLFLKKEPHYLKFFQYYLNRPYEPVDEKKRVRILESREFKKMDVYPNGEYAKVIDDTIVVKLSK